MQWTYTCILLASIAMITASNNGVRSKRDLSFFKNHIFSKIFGYYNSNTTAQSVKPANYRLFKVPGFDNILVKAVPKVPVVVETDLSPPDVVEVAEAEPVPVHPSIAIVSKYLGTHKLNDTLFALKGVKNLLQSGVLTAQREGSYQFKSASFPSVLVESDKIVVDEAQRPVMVYPSLNKMIRGRYRPVPRPVGRYPNLPIPMEYSYKQINNDGVMTYTAHDNQNVIVTETKRPVPLPQPITYRIQDILSMTAYSLPTSPIRHMGIKSYPAPVHVYNRLNIMPYQPLKVMPSYVPSGYSYNQVHNDGSMTTFTGSGHVVEQEGDIPVVITDTGKPPMSVVVTEIEGPAHITTYKIPKGQVPPQSVSVPDYNSGYSYNQVHSDGTVTSYSGSGNVVNQEEEKTAVVITEPGRPTVVVADFDDPPAPFPTYKVPKVPSYYGHGYSYKYLNNGGNVNAYSGTGQVKEPGRGRPAFVVTEPGRPTVVVPDVQGPPAPFPVQNKPQIKEPSYGGGYLYSHVHHDGSVTTYSGTGEVQENEEEKNAIVITEPGSPTVVVPDNQGPPVPFPIPQRPPVKIPSFEGGYSYKHVHNDGSVTSYSGSGKVEEHEGGKPAVVITEPGRPTVVVPDNHGPPAPFPTYNGPQANVPSYGGGYSYKHVHDDGSMTYYSGSGKVEEQEGGKPAVVITEPGRPTIVVSDNNGPPAPFPVPNRPPVKIPSFENGYSYKHVHNDGSVSSYSGSGQVEEHEGGKPAVVLTEPGRPTIVVSDNNGPPAPLPTYNGPQANVLSYGGGYSYKHVHNDGSMTAYSGSGQVEEHEGNKPAVVITEPGRPTVVVSDNHGPPAPFPTYNGPQANVLSYGGGYSYKHVHDDGSMTYYSGSGKVEEQEGGKQAVVITEPGRPTVVVSDNHGPPAPFPIYNVPQANVPSYGGGYSYKHVHNDGSMTGYSGFGQVEEHEREKPAVVITKPGRPTVVVSDIEGPPAPLPIYNGYKAPLDGSSYSYNQVHNSGSMTSYTGSGHIKEHEGGRGPVVITQPGRPTVVVPDAEGPPAPFPILNTQNIQVKAPTGYSYHHVHNDGSVSSYSGSEIGEEYGGNEEVIVTEIKQPVPLPPFLSKRLESVAATAMAGRYPSDVYSPPAPIYHEYSVITEEKTPTHMAGNGNHNTKEVPQPPNFEAQVNTVDNNNGHSRPIPNVPSGFSYKTVHKNGSVTSYSNAEEAKGDNLTYDRPMLYPTAPEASYINDNLLAKPVICKDPTHRHDRNNKSHTPAVSSISSNYSYQLVSGGTVSTLHSSSGQVEHKDDNTEVVSSIVADPILVTQTDDDNPERVSLTPVLSQFSYKRINHNKPDAGELSNSRATSAPSTVEPPSTEEKTSEVVISTTVKEIVPSSSRRPLVAVPTSTKSGHIFKAKRVFRHRVKSSTSRSSSRALKTSAPVTTTISVPSSTDAPTEGALSANPIVVAPEPQVFSFKQQRTDGSSITVLGNKENKVSVLEEEPKSSPNRGDIPESSF